MNQPGQQRAEGGIGIPDAAIEVTVVADADTAKRLNRAAVLARWRSPGMLGLIFALPLLVMIGRIVGIVGAVNDPGFHFTNLVGTYFLLLGFVVVIAALLTSLRLVRRDPSVLAYAAAGTPISARYQRDSVQIALSIRTLDVQYDQVGDLFRIGGAMYLRVRGTRGLALPVELFPDAALELMRRPRVAGDGKTRTTGRRRRMLVIAATAVVAILAVVVAVAWRGSDDNSAGALPDPCVLSEKQLKDYELEKSSDFSDPTKRGYRSCTWVSIDKTDPAISRARILVESVPNPTNQEGTHYRVGSAANGVDGTEFLLDLPREDEAMCRITVPTSFGDATIWTSAFKRKVPDTAAVCRYSEDLANAIFSTRWR